MPKYLIEIIPLIAEREIASTEDKQIVLLKRDANESVERIVSNANDLLTSMERNLEHFVSPNHSSRSLSIIPLFYWYNQKAQYARGLLYGFVYWMLTGTEEDITNRKLVFSANRDRFEYILFDMKREIATLQEKGGAGLYATKRVAEFFQVLLELLHKKPGLVLDSDELRTEVIQLLRPRARLTSRYTKPKTSRSYSRRDKTQINIRELFENSIRCHICGGVVNLQQGLQYDHTEDYADTGVTDPETGKPTHPFCNRHKEQIQAYRDGQGEFELPSLELSLEREKKATSQLDFFEEFFGEDNFPR